LFTKIEVKQALFFALFVEIAVIIFIILPSSIVTFRMEESYRWIKKAARKIEMVLCHKKEILGEITKKEDQMILKEELKDVKSENLIIENDKKEEIEQLKDEIYLHRVSVKLYHLYKLWKARIPLGFRIDFSARNEFNFRFGFTKDLLYQYFISMLFTLIPAFFIRFIS
jgi:hypothetical protein